MATQHGKERAFGPVLAERLGLELRVPEALDTDRLGTFTGEVERVDDIEQTALAKARLGLETSGLDLAVANEGAFGPHPMLPFAALGIEVAVLLDRRTGRSFFARVVEDRPRFEHVVLERGDEVDEFLARAGFPEHRLIVRSGRDALGPCLAKGVGERATLESLIARAAAESRDGAVFLQTDMRAMHNPTRMDTLRRLAEALAERVSTPCPSCGAPGFGRTGVERGLPCEWCGGPTQLVRAETWGCDACGLREVRARPDGLTAADPGQCPACNP